MLRTQCDLSIWFPVVTLESQYGKSEVSIWLVNRNHDNRRADSVRTDTDDQEVVECLVVVIHENGHETSANWDTKNQKKEEGLNKEKVPLALCVV